MSEHRPGPAAPRPPELPAWPVLLLFAGYPLLWLLGLSAFAAALCAVPMALLLWLRGGARVPRAFGLWALFLLWVVACGLQVEGAGRLIGVGVRLSNYLGAAVVFVYVVNAERLTWRRMILVLCGFFAVVVAGGWLGVLMPDVRLTTPTQVLLPPAIAENEYVQDLVSPSFAEVQQPYGAPEPFTRPSAPFAYTNGWGLNLALLVPVVVAGLTTFGRRGRAVLGVLLVAASVPAAATLNRGMYLAVGIGLTYGALRLAQRRRFGALLAVVGGGAAAVVVAVSSGVASSLQERLEYSSTTDDRMGLYVEAVRGALASPLLGHGAPQPSEVYVVSVGTQGQVWNVLFSYGFPGLLLFGGWFAVAAWASRRWADAAGLWLHTTLVVALVTTGYYGYDGVQLAVVMAVAATVLRPRGQGLPEPPPTPASAVSGGLAGSRA